MAGSRDEGEKPRKETEEYKLGDDFLADLDPEGEDEDLDPETYERDALEGEVDDEQYEDDSDAEELDEQDEIDEIVSAETVEWTPEDVEQDDDGGEDEEEPAAGSKLSRHWSPPAGHRPGPEGRRGAGEAVSLDRGTEAAALGALQPCRVPDRRLDCDRHRERPDPRPGESPTTCARSPTSTNGSHLFPRADRRRS